MINMTNDRLVPTQPSNRSVLHQLQLWGWTMRASTGDWLDMHHPDRSERVRVRPEHYHSANGRDVLTSIYRVTCNGSGEAFWGRTDPYFQSDVRFQKAQDRQMTEAEMEEYAAEQRAIHEPAAEEPTTESVEAPVEQVTRAAEGKSPQPVYGKAPRASSMEAKVLNVLEALAPSEVTIAQIQGLLGMTRMEISGVISRLADRGFVLRDPLGRKGVYRRSGLQAETAERAATLAPKLVATVTTQQGTQPHPEAAAVTADVVDDLLDLMFPGGFKARHLQLVEEWRVLTRRMIEEINQ